MSSLTEKKNALFGAKSAADGDAAPVSLPATASKTAGISLSSSGVSAEVKKKKTQEGSELAAKAEGLLKTSLFQWTPDYIAAAPMFEAASDCYKQAGEFRTACQLLERAASASEKNNVLSAAAVAMRKASEIAQKELRDKALTAQYLERSAEYWGLSGDLEKNAETLAKAATELETLQPEKAQSLYKRALTRLYPEGLSEDKVARLNPYTLEIARSVLSFTLKENNLKDGLALAQRMVVLFRAFESESSMCKAMLTITIIELSLGDYVKANQTYLQEHLGNSLYLRSKECEVADLLLMAFQNHDIDTLEKGKMHVQLNYLDKEVQRLAKNLSFFATKDRTTTKLPASAVSATKEISYSSATTALPASDDGKSALFAFKQKADEKLSKSNGEAQEKTEEAVADEELDAKLDDLHEELDNILENGGWEEEENEEEGSDKEIAPSSQANVEAKVQEEAEVSLANNQVAEEDEDEDELDLR